MTAARSTPANASQPPTNVLAWPALYSRAAAPESGPRERPLRTVAGLGATIRTVSYALYCTAIATDVLIALGLPHPSSLRDEGERVLYTFVGVGIAVLVMALASLLAGRASGAEQRQEKRAARPHVSVPSQLSGTAKSISGRLSGVIGGSAR